MPPSCLVSADKCTSHKIIRQDRHLEAMPREIYGIVVVPSYEEVWQYNIPPSQSAETGELVGLVWWGCRPSGDQSGADVPSPGTHISASTTWSQFLRRIVAESRIPSWMLALHGPMVSPAPWCRWAPKAAPIRVSRSDSFIKWPMQPHRFCTLCITPAMPVCTIAYLARSENVSYRALEAISSYRPPM